MVQGLLQDRIAAAVLPARVHALSIDLEDYFMVSAFEPYIAKSDWARQEARLKFNVEKILRAMDEFDAKATFFSVGWVGEVYPDLVRGIHDRGHEIACHGYHHRLIYEQTPEAFRQDVRKAKQILEDIIGAAVLGYRAPSFSLTEKTKWALDILEEEGYRYDASLLPAPHARGGFAGAQRFPHRRNGLVEFPMSTMRVAGKTFPFSGGGYFRLFPFALIRRGLQACWQEGHPGIVYLHPWEFDPDQPRFSYGSRLDRFKHYLNLSRTEEKFRRLLSEFSFAPVRAILTDRLSLLD